MNPEPSGTWLNASALAITSSAPEYVGTNTPLDQLQGLFKGKTSHLLVTIGGTSQDSLAGIISRRDLLRAQVKQGHPKARTARDIMSPFDLAGRHFNLILGADSVTRAMEVLIQPVIDIRSRSLHHVGALPIVEDVETKRVAIGIITTRDIVRYLHDHRPQLPKLRAEEIIDVGDERELGVATERHTIGSLFSYFAITKTKILPIVDDYVSMRLQGTISDLDLYDYLIQNDQDSVLDRVVGTVVRPPTTLITSQALLVEIVESFLNTPDVDGIAVVDNLSGMKLRGIISLYNTFGSILHSKG